MSPVKPQRPMPKLPIEERLNSFNEVALGYSEDDALAEAERCLQCKAPRCIEGCPVGVNIPKFIRQIREGKPERALEIVRERNSLPAICGRVCPQENQCMGRCVLGLKSEPVNIGALERFVADISKRKNSSSSEHSSSTGMSVAVVGSGPAGLTAAAELAKLGHEVTVFEALHRPGGVLTYGIPDFRLPKDIVRSEVDYVESLGVKIETNIIIGRVVKISELFEMGFDAVLIGSGAGLPTFLGVPGENLNGVYSANEFLIRINMMGAYNFPNLDTPVKVGRKVAVIGGGNVAMDAARCALRLGGEVTVIYRRTEDLMPARRDEIINAKEEGVKFMFLATPKRFIGDEKGWVRRVECLKIGLGERDDTGRKKPVTLSGSEFQLEADTVIIAIGQRPNPLAVRGEERIRVAADGRILVRSEAGETDMPGVFAAGDIVSGDATVISAMGGGKMAALAIHEYLIRKSSG
ncbi:MAG: NADPH-dependent glutamate synthase [Nitrososphaerota archaeon]|nr:NADPH-dependent glutamate synthase [Candidatus Bathyarchaeota archaeon]MDW8048553.1 NADPH-dependent glutamate synthase [Nitrososphaerota archaeon]